MFSSSDYSTSFSTGQVDKKTTSLVMSFKLGTLATMSWWSRDLLLAFGITFIQSWPSIAFWGLGWYYWVCSGRGAVFESKTCSSFGLGSAVNLKYSEDYFVFGIFMISRICSSIVSNHNTTYSGLVIIISQNSSKSIEPEPSSSSSSRIPSSSSSVSGASSSPISPRSVSTLM